jgi:2-iminobutanoate/2-iminopropanoate deaminase
MNCKTVLMLTLAGTISAGCATTAPVIIERKHYGDWEKNVGYTQAVRVGNTLYMAGIGGQGDTQIEQMNDIYKTIDRILTDYQATSRNIVKEVIYTTNIDELIAATDARKNYYQNADYPSSTWVQVTRLYSPKMKIEIDITVQLTM